MKKLLIIPILLPIFMAACTSRDLSRNEAFKQIKQERNFPVVIDYDIYCGDPKYGKQALDAGLEAAGLVTALKSRKLGDISKPFVTFTENLTTSKTTTTGPFSGDKMRARLAETPST